MSPLFLFLFLSVALSLALLLLSHFLSRSPIALLTTSRKATPTIILFGPPGSGKTYLFTRLVFGVRSPKTATSWKENEGLLRGVGGGKKVHLVDIPSHPRLRTRILAQFLGEAEGVILVVDPKERPAAAAEALHLLLTLISLLPSSTPPPRLLILFSPHTPSPFPSSSLSPNPKTTTTSQSLQLARAKTSLLRSLSLRLSSSTSTSSRPGTATLDMLGNEKEGKGLPREEGEVWNAGGGGVGVREVYGESEVGVSWEWGKTGGGEKGEKEKKEAAEEEEEEGGREVNWFWDWVKDI